MDTLTSPLVITKLQVPATRPRLVPRAHLIERLTPKANTGLILVCAPAGYGKTTLLAAWAQDFRQNGGAVAWYALDSSDDDPIPFGSYLVASLMQAIGPLPELAHFAQLLRSSPEIDLQRILPVIINAAATSDQECLLILDDYHLIGSPAIHSGIAYLLERLPENLHIAIGSRSDPPLPLARLRARGRLLEVRAADLRFTTDETARFLNDIMKLDLPTEAVSALEARTEGWVAGLQLAVVAMQLPQADRPDKESVITSFTGSHRYLVEYLLEEVVNRQPEQVQSFLLSTSILERLCAPLCDAILSAAFPGTAILGESSGSEGILEHLEQANLFLVALDDQGYWYRYHHLFRDFLQSRLQKTQPERAASLHRLASAWHGASGFLREGAQHAFKTRDWEFAAAFVEQHSFTLLLHSELSTMYEWCSAFPEEVMRRHPMLCILECWALVFGFRRQNRERVEERLGQAEKVIAGLEDRQMAHDLHEHAAVVRSFLAMAPDPTADPREQIALAQNMLGAFSEGEPGQFSGMLTIGYAQMALHDAGAARQTLEAARQMALRGSLFFGVAESTFHLACLAHSQGMLTRAVELCRQGQADIASMLDHPEQELPALGSLDIALGCVLLEQDRLEEAERGLLHGLELIGWGMNPYYLMTAYLALYRLREIQGRSAEALDSLARLEEAWPDVTFCTRGLRVVHSLRNAPVDPGALAEAAVWRKTFPVTPGEDAPPPGMGPFGAAEAYYQAYLAWTRTQIAAGNAQAAQSYLVQQLDLASTHGLTNRLIELSLLDALAWQAQGVDRRARAALERALAAAQPEGYLRIFDQGVALTRLLVDAVHLGISQEYIQRILAVIHAPKPPGAGLESISSLAGEAVRLDSGEHISERELEVLRLMARGASNHEIAEQLVITVGTVKSHINHILVKLDAHNRTEAVARARGLGMIDI
jgi:LuxR family maltose regulon positive regulatory protein